MEDEKSNNYRWKNNNSQNIGFIKCYLSYNVESDS